MESKGYVLLEKYEIGKLLGQGTFAKVHHGKNLETGANVAVKIIDKEKVKKAGLMEQIKREISVMKMVKHRNTVELYEVLATKTKIYLVMEYVRGGELFNKVAKGKLREETARKYFVQLVSAVEYCHGKGVVHRDLKPENLLLDDDGNLKVTDFGLCALSETKRHDGLLHTMCGTPAYVAPEVILRKGYDGCKVDIWSCGVILYVLLAGYLPFQDQNLMEMYRKITKADYKFPSWFSSQARKLLTRILDPNPQTRISIEKILASSWCRTGLSSTADDEAPQVKEAAKEKEMRPFLMNAFEIISHSAGLDLSGFFKEKIREVRFCSKNTAPEIFAKIDEAAAKLGLKVKKREMGVMKMEGLRGRKGPIALEAQVFEITPLFHMVGVKKSSGDTFEFQRMINNEIRPQLHDIVWKWHNDYDDVTALS